MASVKSTKQVFLKDVTANAGMEVNGTTQLKGGIYYY